MNPLQTKSAVPPRELHRLLGGEAPVDLLDVRSPAEFESAHVPGARLVPLDALDAVVYLNRRGADNRPIYVLCQSGGRARRAIEKFERAGFEGCVLVEGGTQAWIDAGLPVNRGERKVLPLMRQVQITVGAVSAVGAVLALLVNPLFAVIPLVTGCGLLFAGVTGFCGLALVLAKMPWNQAAGAGCVAGSCCGTER